VLSPEKIFFMLKKKVAVKNYGKKDAEETKRYVRTQTTECIYTKIRLWW